MAGIDGMMADEVNPLGVEQTALVEEETEVKERKRTRKPIDPFDLGRVPVYNDERKFSISPSSWNNFVACPRRFWLSRRRLPRKAGMAASVGTIVHGALEDILLLDLEGKEDNEKGWVPVVMERLLNSQWEDEKKRFFAHQRQPKWKEESREKAMQLLGGSMDIVLKRSGVGLMPLEDVTVGFWKWVQSLMGAIEGELKTSDGKIMGRLDVMMYDIDTSGEVVGWIVADLKTGRPPTDGVYDTVSRQLRLYRDLLSENNPDHPPITSEAWYSDGSKVFTARGDSVLEEAFAAWDAMYPTPEPPPATPSNDACGFCEWKAWCPAYLPFRQNEPNLGSFSDLALHVERYEEETGAAVFSVCAATDDEGGIISTDRFIGGTLEDQSKEVFEEIRAAGWDEPIFCSSILTQNGTLRIGHWSDVLPYAPIVGVVEGRMEGAPELKKKEKGVEEAPTAAPVSNPDEEPDPAGAYYEGLLHDGYSEAIALKHTKMYFKDFEKL